MRELLSTDSRGYIEIYILKYKLLKKVSKGVWGMPRLLEAKKDVISCEKLRGSAHMS